MNFDRLHELLLETPIDQFQLHGDWSDNAKKRGFDNASIKLLQNYINSSH